MGWEGRGRWGLGGEEEGWGSCVGVGGQYLSELSGEPSERGGEGGHRVGGRPGVAAVVGTERGGGESAQGEALEEHLVLFLLWSGGA